MRDNPPDRSVDEQSNHGMKPEARGPDGPIYISCAAGAFTLPDSLLEKLRAMCRSEIIYVRQDEDVFTISAARIADGRRRKLVPRFKAAIFVGARMLVALDMGESIQVMAVEWRVRRAEAYAARAAVLRG